MFGEKFENKEGSKPFGFKRILQSVFLGTTVVAGGCGSPEGNDHKNDAVGVEHKEHGHEHHLEEKMKYFLEQQPIMDKIKKQGMAEYVKTIENLERAFRGGRCMQCIDERTCEDGFHAAGSGILRRREDIINLIKRNGITEIKSHDGCGAAALFVKNNKIEGNSDEVGKNFAKEIAAELKINYSHTEFKDMKGPKEFHFAGATYFDGTAKFSHSNVAGLPPGFVISRGMEEKPEEALKEVDLSIKIAFGDHGFGKLFSKERPFYIIVIGKSEEQLAQLTKEVKTLKFPEPEKIKIDGFVAPMAKE